MSEHSEKGPPDDRDDELRHWEARLEGKQDPFEALAEVLGGSSSDRTRLFRLSGTVLLGCTLQHMLGSGGAGVTYSGIAGDGTRVAVKLVMAQTLSSVERFEQECRLLQSLEHPAIVRYRAHAVQDDGTGVLVMDLVDGTDFESVLQQVQDPRRAEAAAARIPAIGELVQNLDLALLRERGQSVIETAPYRRRILRFLAIVADGLHHAHERGVVHRDVKPPNILVDVEFAPVLIDFGLARDLRKLVSFTQSGIAIGTLAYMAPEQLDADTGPVDHRVDVYSLGLVLYRAMTGTDLRQVPEDVWRSRRRAFLLDSRASRELPLAVQAILYACLDPRPDRRYPDTRELARDLRAAAEGGVVGARMPSWFERQCRDPLNFAAILVGMFSALATILWLQWPRGREVEFLATCEANAAVVVVDGGGEQMLSVPVWLPLGAHKAKLVGNDLVEVEREFVVEAGEGPMRVPFSTYQHYDHTRPSPRGPRKVPVVLTTGYSDSQPKPGIPRDKIFVDRQDAVEASYSHHVVLLDSDLHELRAVDGRGRAEEQLVVVGSEALDIQLLPAAMADVEGSFRRTWSTVLSPLPPGVSLRGNVQPWIGTPRTSPLSTALQQAPCALAPAVVRSEVDAVLRVDFPVPMRSAVLLVSTFVGRGGKMDLEVVADGELPMPWPRSTEGRLLERVAVRAKGGARWLELRARMTTSLAAVPAAQIFCGTQFGLHRGPGATAFAIVADEGDRAVVPDLPAAAPLADVPKLGCEELRAFDGRELGPPVVLGHRDGRIDLLVPELAGNTDAGPLVAAGRLRRMRWPSREEYTVLEAECMHIRTRQDDGWRFGVMVQPANDRDGDGWADFAVVDTSSDRLGSQDRMSIARFCSSSRDPDWIWPPFPRFGPVEFSACQMLTNVGDWNGDGDDDFAVRGERHGVPPGLPGASFEILDGCTAAKLTAFSFTRSGGMIGCLDALPMTKGARPLLYWQCVGEGATVRDLYLHLGGPGGTTIGPLSLPWSCHALLVPSRRDPSVPDLVVVRFTRWQTLEPGFERYEVSGTNLELVDREQFQLPFFREPVLGIESRGGESTAPMQRLGSLVRVGDLDRDGVSDFAVPALAVARKVGVLFVSGATLKPIAQALVPGVTGATGTWVPKCAEAEACLVLACRTPTGSSLRRVILP